MASYIWRVTNGDFALATDWLNATTGADPAATPPGTSDTAVFATTGGTVSGMGSVQYLAINTGSAAPWVFTGSVTANLAILTSVTSFSAGATLTVTGSPGYPSYSGVFSAPVTLTGATLAAAATDVLVGEFGITQDPGGSSLAVTAGSTASALNLFIGDGTSGTVTVTGAGSTLTTAATTTYPTAGELFVGQQQATASSSVAGTGTLVVSNGGSVTVGNKLVVGVDAGSVGAVTISSGGTLTLAGGLLTVGNLAGSTGTLTIDAGGSLVSTETPQAVNYILQIGQNAASAGQAAAMGTVTVQGQNAVLNMGNNQVAVGYGGTGVLNVLSGGTATMGTSNGNALSALGVGRYGSGTVNITGPGAVLTASGGVYDGRAAGGTGTINVTQGGTLLQMLDINGAGGLGVGIADTLSGQVGSGGTGTLNVNTGGTVLAAGNFSVGNNGTTGTVALDTAGQITTSGIITVGTGSSSTGGTGTVTIAGGAALRSLGPHTTGSASIAIANSVATVGNVTVTGGGSVLDAGGDRISVGGRGIGSLTVISGAAASAGNTLYSDAAAESGLSIAAYATGSGTVAVSGAGSTIAVNGTVALAGALTSAGGTGSLAATSGGTVTATGLVLWAGGILAADGSSLVEIGSGTAAATGIAIQSGATLTAHGGTIVGAVANNGTLSNDGSLTVTGAVTGAGGLSLLSGSTTDISGSIAGEAVSFAGATGTLRLHTLAGAAAVTAVQGGDVIDLLGITNATLSGTSVHTASGELDFTNLAPGSSLVLTTDGNGGTDVNVACYCLGTAILTVAGERPIEQLRIGDRLVTATGQARRLRWIGRRSYAGRFLLRNRQLWPIRFAAGSLGKGLPRRDLLVSPAHAMLLDGVLIPAADLVNGHSIRTVERLDQVDYLHLELDTHDVILAEGAASETYIDDDSRMMFHNAAEYAVLYPHDAPTAPYCAPRLRDGPLVEAVRQRLAGPATTEARAGER